MDFSESGLPQDPVVYQAFVDLRDYFANAPAEVEEDAEEFRTLAINATRILQQNTAATGEALALPLLVFSTPINAVSALKKNYGVRAYELVLEAQQHNDTANAYLTQASPEIKRLTLATCIATFENFTRASRKMREDLDKVVEEKMRAAEAGQEEGGEAGSVFMPLPMPIRFYNNIATATQSLNENDARLYALYVDRLNEFKAVCSEQMSFLESRGIPMQVPKEIFEDTRLARPEFADSGLPQDAKVKACYDLIVQDPRVEEQNFQMALEVAKVLSSHRGVGATAIAAALADISQENWQPVDFKFIGEKVDWDVIAVLENNTVHASIPVNDLRQAPEEFQQVMTALMVCKLRNLSRAAEKFFDNVLPEHGEKVPKEVLHNNLISIERALINSRAVLDVLAPMADTPTLHKDLGQEVQKFTDQVKGILERFRTNKSGSPAPKPKAQQNDKSDFTL